MSYMTSMTSYFSLQAGRFYKVQFQYQMMWPVMLNEAKISRPRSRPELWGQGRGRGQFLDVEVKAEGKDKIMNKKYQMMVDNIQANLYHYDQNGTV